jgi:hypothetical protein
MGSIPYIERYPMEVNTTLKVASGADTEDGTDA